MPHDILKYAIVKALYDSDSDSYISSLIPLIAKTFLSVQTQTKLEIQRRIELNYDITIPVDVIQSVLAAAITKEYFQYNSIKRTYTLTRAGEEYLSNFADEAGIKREKNSFISDLQQYSSQRGYDFDAEKIELELNQFISKNLLGLSLFLGFNDNKEDLSRSELTGYESVILDYVFHIENEKPAEFNFFYNMILGSVLLISLNSGNKSKIDEIRNSNFESCNVYLDTNFLFSLLKLHNEAYIKPAEELYQILKQLGFNVKVFSFTIDEIIRVLKGYKHYADKYTIECKVDSVYYVLKERRFTTSDIVGYISEIETKLNQIGLEIDNSFCIDLKNFKPKNKQTLWYLSKKNYNNKLGLHHDAAVIERIQELRGKPMRKLDECKYFFISSDTGLSHINLIDMGHHSRNTIPEVIRDSTFTNILWFKYPNIKLPISTILSFHSKGLFINRKVWDKFYGILSDLKDSGEISDEDISALVYDSTIQNELRDIRDSETKDLSKNYIFEKIDEVRDRRKQKEIEMTQEIQKTYAKESKKEFEEFLEGMVENKEIKSKKYAKLIVRLSKVIISLLVLLLLCSIIANDILSDILKEFAVIIPVGVAAFTILGINFVRLWDNIENYVFQFLYDKSLEEFPSEYTARLK